MIRIVLFGVFVVLWSVVYLKFFGLRLSWTPWPEVSLLLVATAVTLLDLAREFYWQNIWLACTAILFATSVMEIIARLTNPNLSLFGGGHALLISAMLWLMSVLGGSQTATRALAHQKSSNHGIYLLGLSGWFALWFCVGSQAYVPVIGEGPGVVEVLKRSFWPASLYWAATAIIALVCAIPALTKKRPSEQKPDSLWLVAWLLLNLLFTSAAFLKGRKVFAATIILCNIVAPLSMIRIPRRKFESHVAPARS